MEMKIEEFNEISNKEACNLLMTKRMQIRMAKKVLEAEKNVYKAVSKFVDNDEMIKLGSWQNIRKGLLDQLEDNLSLAIRYLRDNEIDSVAMSYLRNCKNFQKQLDEKNNDEYYLSLKDKYIENAYKFIPEEKLTEI